MLARLLLAFALALAPAPQVAADGGDGSLRARLWLAPEGSRLVLEGGEELPHKIIVLENPTRVVMDVTVGGVGKFPGLDNADLSDAADYLSNFRYSRFDAKRMRFVFEIKDDARTKYNATNIKPLANYGWRLIFDLEPENPPDPLLALLKELDALEKKEEAEVIPFRVVIDPGHGGEDPGAVSPNNNYEKKTVLAISRELGKLLNAQPGVQAILTRNKDKFIKLGERVRIAQRWEADAFISVHADSVKSPRARGSSVFVLSSKGASSRFARLLAKQANLSDLVGGESIAADDPAVAATLREFSRDGKERGSRDLAKLILQNIGAINKLHSKRVESAGFAVLKSPSIPSVLVETAFISNPAEEKKLLSTEFRKKMAAAIAQGVMEYKTRYHVAQP